MKIANYLLTKYDGSLLVSSTDNTVYTYDYAGRLISQANPDRGVVVIGGNNNGTIATQYNANGTVNSKTDANGFVTYYSYDGLNRLIEQWMPLEKGNPSSPKQTIKLVTYDPAISESIRYDANGNKLFITDKNGVITENQFDALNRLKSTTITVSGVAHTTSYAYDIGGNQLTITDWLGNLYTYCHNEPIMYMDPTGHYEI